MRNVLFYVAATGIVAAVAGCSSDNRIRTDGPVTDARDAADRGSGGAPGTGGVAGPGGGSGGSVGGAGGSPGSDASDASDNDAGAGDVPEVLPPLDPATAKVCAISIVTSTYNPAMAGCGGVAACRGVLRYTNNSGVTLGLQVISFNVPDGVTCTRTHSNSRWIIFDNGATSHKCVFTTNTSNPWNVGPGGSFSFGYELSGGDVNDAGAPPDTGSGDADPSDGGSGDAGSGDGGSGDADQPDAGPVDAAPLPPSMITNITVSDPACMPPDGGADGAPTDAPADVPTDMSGDGSGDSAGDGAPAEAG